MNLFTDFFISPRYFITYRDCSHSSYRQTYRVVHECCSGWESGPSDDGNCLNGKYPDYFLINLFSNTICGYCLITYQALDQDMHHIIRVLFIIDQMNKETFSNWPWRVTKQLLKCRINRYHGFMKTTIFNICFGKIILRGQCPNGV